MATVTPNFNWPVPTSTDLVKDGATAIEALGDSIDASLVDLKGGTTGQVLSKNSNTDMDFTWVTDPGGDITGVTAGTGISGGGTSGTVTVTNSMATAIDAKGDLIAGTGADAFDRLAVGTNGQVLTADSTTATGLKWATASSGSTFNGARVWKSTTQSFANATAATITFDSESYDTNAYHSNTTNNSRLTVPSTGYYQLSYSILFATNSGGIRIVEMFKNTTSINYLGDVGGVASALNNTQVFSATAGDYFELKAYQNSGGSLSTNAGGEAFSFFSIQYLGA